jgi:glycosyltransferase involved in cell wall biosynthesis
MKCGIAFYVSDLIDSLPMLEHHKYALHYGINLTQDAVCHADVSTPVNLKKLARAISQSKCDVVSLQHEFGIWGGVNGEFIVDFLDETIKPLISTLHTTFRNSSRPAVQSSILRRIVNQSAVSFVLTPQSRETLCDALSLSHDAVSVVPHGIPDIPFVPLTFANNRADKSARSLKLCSIGFFRPDKGLEETLRALSVLKSQGVAFQYVIAGSPQPQFMEQQSYLRNLKRTISELSLEDRVLLDIRFLNRSEQIQLIQDSHVGIFAYQTPYQSSSGTIPLVMAAGRPVICTPFEFALAKKLELDDGVILARDFGSAAIADAISQFILTECDYGSRDPRLNRQTREWLWRTVGSAYNSAFYKAHAGQS